MDVTNQEYAAVERLRDEFLRTYYHEQIGEFVTGYPKDGTVFHVEYDDLYRYDSDIADDVIEAPGQSQKLLEEALATYDLPVDVSLDGASVHVTDTKRAMPGRGVEDLTVNDLGRLVAVDCQIEEVTERKSRMKIGAFRCRQCNRVSREAQEFNDTTLPPECENCGRQGPFEIVEHKCEWVDQRKLKLESPPEANNNASVEAYCLGDMADAAGGKLHDKAGSRVRVIGKLEADKSSLFGGRDNTPVADEYVVVKGFAWGGELNEDIAVEEHRDMVEQYAGREDAVDLFARSIHPSLVVTEQWETAIEMCTAWVFGAQRIDPPEGDTIRGDIHMLFVSDPGMNKSNFASKLAELSPQCLLKDSEGMSSEVALTAAATREGFGDGQWSIKPGAGPKANGGHLILDEVDKGPDGFLNGMHSLLEGEQVLKVEKAGKEATLATRFGFMALGNPKDGSFDRYDSISEQVDLHDALMSRFDLICAMEDSPGEEHDTDVANGVLDSIDESARIQDAELAPEDANATQREVPKDVMRAWVQIAREEITPQLTDDAKAQLAEYYVDARGLNDESETDTAPTTARTLMAGWRLSAAFARVELSDTIEPRHAKRAIRLSKYVVGLNYDPDSGEFDAARTNEAPSTQQQRRDAIKKFVRENGPVEVSEVKDAVDVDDDTVERDIEKLKQKAVFYEPTTGEVKKT